MTDRYSEWRDFYAEKVRSWMSLEELRAECGKLQTVDNPSPEVLLIHAMHALEECEQRNEALLRQAVREMEQAVEADHHPDSQAVDRFAAAMKEKLAQARAKGRSGWQNLPSEELSRMLREHVEKGDPLDVANFCMFLWTLGHGIGAEPA